MRIENCKKIYENFDKFINEFIIKKNSILTSHKDILSEENINECIRLFIDNSMLDKRNFDEKIKEQFENANDSEKLVLSHAIWLWAMAVSDISKYGKEKATKICLNEATILNQEYFDNGFGSGGTYHKQNKYNEIVFNIKLFQFLEKYKPKDIEECKLIIERTCIYKQYTDMYCDDVEYEEIRKFWNDDTEKSCAMYNILLHLCNSDKYEPIIAQNHKAQLISTFESLLDENDLEENIDEKITVIRSAIENNNKGEKNFNFYDPKILELWNPVMSDKTYSEYQALKYKKSIILYGPPGTSKTYSAKKIAKSFILQQYILQDKDNIKKYIEEDIKVENYVHHLQLHNNYSYEDFIAGMQLKNGQTESVKGYFLNLCESIKDDTIPHILILDEINRVDVARLFGELFSGIENREQVIDLAIGGFNIKVPKNLYIIGTMNEIDFSLEQIDFALRRRFIWFFYGFNEDVLNNIIKSKREKIDRLKIVELDLERFKENAKLINEQIRKMDELGKEYEIGHAFFGEIIDIANGFNGKTGYSRNIPLFKKNGPAEVLWNISIRPIIEAFLGSLEKDTLENVLVSFKEIFLNGGK
ncbi:AAA family ATPase [Clostridium sardiniense]|uniref:AAA family ATPase n=1 Tax=Clostridium sardiniense TaxID=29369 RepID=A0ABS7KYH4_CLOSR|nr:AAA family ATPase [Clostridium sardiniense]MBY0755863.1 AAA family ATPase [Clostridium sardiniense]MDQ0459908.1 5-methylcytosine-specific restriction protein B [Clostridium sardiniense]